MLRFLSLALLLTIGLSAAALDIDKSFWNTNWNVMNFQQSGTKVTGEYIYDDGILSATLSGDTLRGWWRESNNVQACGPEKVWSGSILFLFSKDGKSFTGDWNYCTGTDSTLDPNSNRWAGTRRDSGYTEKECVAGGRFWCNSACGLIACDSVITETQCKETGRFWCSEACGLVQCSAGIQPFQKSSLAHSQARSHETYYINLLGQSIEPSAPSHPSYYIFQR
jgi:hypothetical protein